MLWESAGAFFPRDNSLISRGNSHVSRVRGLVVRCLLFNNSEVRVRTRGYALIFRSRKKFSTTYAIVLFFFLPTFSWKFQISQKLSIRFSRNFAQSFYTQRGPCVCKGIKIVWPGCEKHSQNLAKKQPFFDFFRFSQKLSIRFERNFLQLFYTILESYRCNGIKIVWLGCEKHSQN